MSTPDYIRLTDADTAALAFWGQDKWRQLRDNQDSFDGRIAQLLAQSENAIVDDFFCDDIAGAGSGTVYPYDPFNFGTGFQTMMGATGDHAVQITTVNSQLTKVLAVSKARLAFRLNRDMVGFFEAWVKDPGSAACDNMIVGFTATPTAPATESDVIAFLKGSSAGKWRFRVAKGGVQSETDNIGNRATSQKLRIEFTRSGGGSTLQIAAYIDGAAISGSPFTTNIPDTTVMRMVWGAKTPAAGTSDFRMDRWECRWAAIPPIF